MFVKSIYEKKEKNKFWTELPSECLSKWQQMRPWGPTKSHKKVFEIIHLILNCKIK